MEYVYLLGIAFFMGFQFGRIASLKDILNTKYPKPIPTKEDPADWWKK